MSWLNNVDWQQLNRDLQNIELLRLQQEQNELLKKSLAKPKAALSSESFDERYFEALQNDERKAFDSLDPLAFINMGDWWLESEEPEKALTSYLNAATLCYTEEPVPGTLCFSIANVAEELGNLKFARAWFERGAEVGDASCANSLIFSYLIPEENWSEIEELVSEAASYDCGEQTTGVYSNGAIALYKQGKLDEAIKLFEFALDRRDHSCDDEAYWWLSRIYADRNEVSKSEKYQRKSEKAGGYEAPDWA